MEALAILIGLIGVFIALSARKSIALLQQQSARAADRIGLLEVGIERLLRAGPPAAPSEAAQAIPEPAAPVPVAEPEPAAEPSPVPVTPLPPEAAQPRAPGPTLEERLGTRWAVWVGGLALALGGLLLVRYSIEQGVLGPGVRVTLAGLFSAALVVAGEWLRRTERTLPIDPIPAAHVPSIVTAAGTASAFGTVYAAHALYGFIGPAAAFVLLGLIGVATMLAAALHGPALAGLGLAGSLAVPLLVSSDAPSPWPLVGYLAAVAAAAYGLARLRRWLWLASAIVAGTVLWGFVLLNLAHGHAEGGWTTALFVHVVAQLALAAAFMALEPHLATPDAEAEPDWIATAALAALTVLAVAALASARSDAQWETFVILAMTIPGLTAWRSAPTAAGAALAGVVLLGALAAWPGLAAPPEARLLAPAVAEVIRLPDNTAHFLVFAAAGGLVLMVLAALRVWRGPLLPAVTASLYLLAATVPALLALVLTYLRVTQFDRSVPFALFAVVLAALFYLLAYRFANRPEDARAAATRLATGCFAAACAAAVTLACVMVLDRGYLTVAFAVTALTTAVFAVHHRIWLLRYVVAAIGVIVLARLAWDPRIMGADVGTWPVLNWLLLGYGAPAAAFLAAGHILKREAEDLAVRICDALGVLLAGLLVFFQIRHALNGGDPLAQASGHVEQGLFALMCFGFAYVLMRMDLGRANPVFRFASLAFGVLSAAFIVLGLAIFQNPWLSNERIGGATGFSTLMLAYLVPGLAAVLLARASRRLRPAWYVLGAGVLSIGLLFGYVTLEVRHAFQGEHIGIMQAAGAPEVWSYSAAWLGLGIVFLAYGIWKGAREARLASAALVILAAVKVFLYDLSGTTGLWRALSVICLGLVLVGIGLAYQKLIFAKPRPALPPPAV